MSECSQGSDSDPAEDTLGVVDLEHVLPTDCLQVLKISGHQLRSDDPLALKDIVVMVKDATSKRDSKDIR